jgi:hypothetical protein
MLLAGSTPQGMPGFLPGLAGYRPGTGGYAPDGTAGRTAAFPLAAVRLLDSPFRANQARNTGYLLFLDPDRILHTFRLNYGLPSAAQPCGGWEAPQSQVRGHTTGDLLSGLALTYANTGSEAARAKGRYLVGQLAAMQALAPSAGYSRGYLSAFPESYFDLLEAQMQMILENEYGRLRQLPLRPRHRAGDPGQVRRHHLLPRPRRPIRQPVHPVRGDLARARDHAAPDDRFS